MGMLDICSNASYWRGLDYFESDRVKEVERINANEFEAVVSGTKDYFVHLDINHPRKSTCTCPHASGKSTICKHKVATYFAVFPEAAKEADQIREDYEREEEEREERIERKMAARKESIQKYVDSLSEEEVRRMLVNWMINDAYDEYIDDGF